MCDALVVAPARSASGRTIFAKNSDRKVGEAQPFLQFPEAFHPPGAEVRCTHVTIPQVAETYRVMGHSPWWVWGFEHGVNEHGVAIGNLTVFSREPVEEQPGLIGMDLVRLGLERGRTAREALEVIAGLIEVHGQGGPALAPGGAGYHNAFALADPDEAWLMQTSGRRWAARRATCDALSNQISLGRDWEIGSRDLESFARARGWWEEGGRLDVTAAYRHPDVPLRISAGRLRRSRELLQRHEKPDVRALQEILRDHLEGGPVRLPGGTPEDESFFTLCMHSEPIGTTTASLVAELPADRSRPWPVWISFGTPCTGVFLPVYLDGILPAALARGGPDPSEDSAFWAFDALREAAEPDFAGRTPRIRAGFAEFEGNLERERLRVEAEAAEAVAAGESDRARELLTDFMERTVAEAMACARKIRESLLQSRGE